MTSQFEPELIVQKATQKYKSQQETIFTEMIFGWFNWIIFFDYSQDPFFETLEISLSNISRIYSRKTYKDEILKYLEGSGVKVEFNDNIISVYDTAIKLHFNDSQIISDHEFNRQIKEARIMILDHFLETLNEFLHKEIEFKGVKDWKIFKPKIVFGDKFLDLISNYLGKINYEIKIEDDMMYIKSK